MFVYLANEFSSNLSLGSIIKQAKLKYNNVLMNALKYGHSFPPTRFGGIYLQPITYQLNRLPICII